MKLQASAIDDGIFANTKEHKRWVDLGIPKDHWIYIENKTAKFSQYAVSKTVNATALNQRQVFLSLVREIKRNHPLVICYGDETDFGALTVAYTIATTYQAASFPVSIVDAQFGSRIQLRRYPRVLVIHNVTTNPTPSRLETVRDLILQYRYALRVVVVGGVPKDPVEWWRVNLRYRQTYTLVCKDSAQ